MQVSEKLLLVHNTRYLWPKFFHSRVLAMIPMSLLANINIAEIYLSILPPEFRSMTCVQVCILRALLFHPQSTNANHRMGIYKLKTKASTDEIIECFDRAVALDIRYGYALVDLIRFYFANVTKYRTALSAILERALYDTYYRHNNVKLGDILFWKSIFLLLDRNDEESINCLIQIHQLNVDYRKCFRVCVFVRGPSII